MEIKPNSLFVPNLSYSFEVQINNRLGFTSKKSLGFKTNSVPQIKSSSLGTFSSNIGPREKFSFTFSELPKSGGSSPFSEPETRALENLVNSEKPALTITYHSSANVVLGDGISENFGDWYANLTGYVRGKNTEEEDSSMSSLGYVITGSFEDWSSRLGNVTLVVEFISATANEYQQNYPALRSLLTYGL